MVRFDALLFCSCASTVLLAVAVPPAEPEKLRVLQFNVWSDGKQVPNGVDKIADIIQASKADVITLSEAQHASFLASLMSALQARGLDFFGEHVGGDVVVISRWPVSGATMVFNHFILFSAKTLVLGTWSFICGLFLCAWCCCENFCAPKRSLRQFHSNTDSEIHTREIRVRDSASSIQAFEISEPTSSFRRLQATSRCGACTFFRAVGASFLILLAACLVYFRNVDFPTDDHGSIVICRLKSPTSGREVLVASGHLDYEDYSVYLPRGYHSSFLSTGQLDKPNTNNTEIDAMEKQSERLPAVRALVDFIEADAELKGLPVIMGGDFNTASHLDWTEDTASLFDHNGVVYEFPCSKLLADNGFLDAWRVVHEDPVSFPGMTWPSETAEGQSTSWAKKADERERIDFIYYRNGNDAQLEPVLAELAGSRKYYVHDELKSADTKDPFILEDMPWPSDHKAVVVDLVLSSVASTLATAEQLGSSSH